MKGIEFTDIIHEVMWVMNSCKDMHEFTELTAKTGLAQDWDHLSLDNHGICAFLPLSKPHPIPGRRYDFLYQAGR